MTATVPETPTPGVPELFPPFEPLPDGVAFLATLRRSKDTTYARELLGLAALVRHRLLTSHPDLDELIGRPMVTGRPYTALRGAIELTARDYAEAHSTDPKTASAQVWIAWTAGTDHRTLWEAVAHGRITVAQAHTIANQAARLHDRTVTVTTTPDGTDEMTPGDPLLTREELPQALTEFFGHAIRWADHDDLHGSTLRGRCFRLIDRMTPHHTAVKQTTRTPGREAVLTPCDDGTTAHLTLDVPLALGRQLTCFANAAADHTVHAATAANLHDPRNHATRANDALVDLLRHALTQHVPAVSDHVMTPTDAEHPPPTPRTHKPATSVQVLLRIDATTLFGTDTHDTADVSWVDGLGPVSTHTALELATTTGATWRKVITAPGTRAVLDVGADAYRPSEKLRRFITARDQHCQGPGCQVPAADCQIDHIVPYPQGPTEVDNLQALCTTDHRYKTQFGWEDNNRRRQRLAARKPAQNPDDDPPPF